MANAGMESAERFLYVKVMTDEQMEVLRRQISVYAAICEQLVEMHRKITASQDVVSETGLGGVFRDQMAISVGVRKFQARQRWTPAPTQLQILESLFDQGLGTPGKQKIREITSALANHGPISETNVYNWFQNRRARSKRKQLASSTDPEFPVNSTMLLKNKLAPNSQF